MPRSIAWRRAATAALAFLPACTDITPPIGLTADAARPMLSESSTLADPAARTFCNPAVIEVPKGAFTIGAGGPFPSTIEVSGIGAQAVKVTATVRGLTHSFARDIDMLLVGPTGADVMLMSDAGGAGFFLNANLTFDDAAPSFVPLPSTSTSIPSGTYKPTYIGTGDAIPPGGPAEPYSALLETFVGTNPNGTWSLYVWDDALADRGDITQGWCVTITTAHTGPTANPGGPYDADEGSPIAFDGSGSTDPDNDIASYAWSFGDGATATGPNPHHVYADNGTYQVKVVVTDDDGNSSEAMTTATVRNVAPSVSAIALPAAPVSVGTPVTITAAFADAGTGDTHAATFDLGNGATAAGTVVEANGSGSASAAVVYSTPGVYTVGATVTDDDGASGSRSSTLDAPAYVVVYDPTAGYVTGGGWIWSPAGALVSNPAASGRASFGFVALYALGATAPSGSTEFHFASGSFNFKSTSHEWLVVAGSRAKFKGAGTVNGAGGYGFMVTAIDGGTGSDAFRIKIWHLATGAVVYDNHAGASDDSYDATTLGEGSIVVHK